MKIPGRFQRQFSFALLITAVGLASAILAIAIDPPHSISPGPADCADCHSTHAGSGFFLINQTYIQDLCFTCHDGVTATEVATHLNPTKGPWQGRDYDGNGQDIVCIDCHDPHSQRSALGENFVGYRGSGGINILRETPGGEREILYNTTGARSSYIKNNPDSGICEVCHSATTAFNFGNDTDTHYGNAASQACGACHTHSDGFTPSGGSCIDCHSEVKGTRRIITGVGGEFGAGFTSHHVSDGTTNEIVTVWDCVVCHAEGSVLTGEADDINFHQKDGVQLKNVDTGAVYNDWAGLTAAQRSEFCLSCHDSDGATIIDDPGRPVGENDPLNPFSDSVTNAHEPDGFDGVSSAPHSRTQVLDVASQFDVLNTSHHAVLAQAYASASPFGSPVDNAIQGVRTDLAWNSTLDCEDCHYGTGTTMLNGHGTQNARYMLRDANGNDNLASGTTIICFRCHNPSDSISVYPEHDKSSHVDDTQNIYGISCLNCHGGGTWGGIHGVNYIVTDDEGGGSYNPNVFTYGSGLDLITNWTSWARRGVTCSTVDVPTQLNNCTNHNSNDWTRNTGNTRSYRNP